MYCVSHDALTWSASASLICLSQQIFDLLICLLVTSHRRCPRMRSCFVCRSTRARRLRWAPSAPVMALSAEMTACSAAWVVQARWDVAAHQSCRRLPSTDGSDGRCTTSSRHSAIAASGRPSHLEHVEVRARCPQAPPPRSKPSTARMYRHPVSGRCRASPTRLSRRSRRFERNRPLRRTPARARCQRKCTSI